MRWHEVAFVKWPGPLYAPPGSVNYYGVTLRWGQETRLALRHQNHIDKLETMNQFPNPLAQHESPLRGFPGGLNKSDSTKDCPKETGRFYFPPLSMFPVLENKNVLFSIESVCACVRLKLRLGTHCKNHCTKNHGKRQLA